MIWIFGKLFSSRPTSLYQFSTVQPGEKNISDLNLTEKLELREAEKYKINENLFFGGRKNGRVHETLLKKTTFTFRIKIHDGSEPFCCKFLYPIGIILCFDWKYNFFNFLEVERFKCSIKCYMDKAVSAVFISKSNKDFASEYFW